jgi:myo-inositol-1(or 4)-monophosphatase
MILKNKKYLSFSHQLADAAGKILIKHYKSQNISKSLKSHGTRNEFVTNIDVVIEKKIRKLINSKFPSHNILGEEEGLTNNESPYTWIIDPIDGTNAYITGIPLFGFMLSLKYKESFILGLVDQPILKERYWNNINYSYLNRKKIFTSKVTKLEDTVITCTDPNMYKNFPDLNKSLFKKVSFVRWGTDVIGYMRCAEGLVDAVIERNIKIWDVAAVEPIIRNAGGVITTWDGKTIGSNDTVCASSNKSLHKILLKKLQKFL